MNYWGLKMQQNRVYFLLSYVNSFIFGLNLFLWHNLFILFLCGFLSCVLALKTYYPKHILTEIISIVGAIAILFVIVYRIFF